MNCLVVVVVVLVFDVRMFEVVSVVGLYCDDVG